MTLEELKVEAEKKGYKLIKNVSYERFMPCICGKNRRERWCSMGEHDWKVKLVCKGCGLSVTGMNDTDAKRKWNEYMRGGE